MRTTRQSATFSESDTINRRMWLVSLRYAVQRPTTGSNNHNEQRLPQSNAFLVAKTFWLLVNVDFGFKAWRNESAALGKSQKRYKLPSTTS